MIKEYVTMETALWVPIVDVEPPKIYSNVTPHVTRESQLAKPNPCSKAPAFEDCCRLSMVWKDPAHQMNRFLSGPNERDSPSKKRQ